MTYTRKQYLEECNFPGTHRKYYAQFVNPSIISLVKSSITVDAILNSNDPVYFNDIRINKWDRLVSFLQVSKKMKECGDYLTLAGGVCILKEAARQILESSKNS